MDKAGGSKKKLDLDSSSSSADEQDEPKNSIKINEKFATSYESWRRKEEISRLKSKYGDAADLDKAWTSDEDEGNRVIDSEDSDSESSTDLDERIAQEEVFDKQFFKCYSALKKKDNKIYNSEVKFFDDSKSSSDNESKEPTVDDEKSSKSNKKITKPKMTLLDYHIKLATGLEADTPENQMSSNLLLDKQDKSHYDRELDEIKNELKLASKKLDDDTSDDDDDLFIKKSTNSQDAKIKNKADRKEIINEEIAKDEDLSYLKDFWHKENNELDEREKFLRDFILNKRYLNDDKDDESDASSDDKASEFFSKSIDDVADGFKSEEDENELEKHNPISKVQKPKFHSDEKNSDQIQRIPRNVTTTIRDLERQQTRKEKRESMRERKKKEKIDELNKLRLFKRQEMEEKLDKLRKISGDHNLTLEDAEMAEMLDEDQDFDPVKYDAKMSKVFNNESYYQGKDEEKPEFEYDPKIDDNLLEDSDEGEEGDGLLQDANNQSRSSDDESETEDNSDGRPRSKRHKKQRINKAKRKKEMKAALYEDVVAGIPTRFKYRKTVPNDFGLSNEELLMATDQELNRWVSLKKTSQYRSEEQELFEQKAYDKQRHNLKLKQKIFKSVYGPKEVDEGDGKSQEDDDNEQEDEKIIEDPDANMVEPRVEQAQERKSKKKHKRGMNHKKTKCGVPEDRLLAYGISKKKLKKSKLL